MLGTENFLVRAQVHCYVPMLIGQWTFHYVEPLSILFDRDGQGSWPNPESAHWFLDLVHRLGTLLYQDSRDGSLWCIHCGYTQKQLCQLQGESGLWVLATRSASRPMAQAENDGLVWVHQMEESYAELLRPGHSQFHQCMDLF